MKKLLVMVSALTAAVFSAAKADISTSGSYGLAAITGGNVSDGDSATTSGTLFMQGGAISFAMSTTTAGGMSVSAAAGASLDSNDSDTAKGVTGLANVTFAADGFSLQVGDVDQVGSGTGHVGNVASDMVDNGGYTVSGINTGIADTEGYGFIASTTVGSASVSLGYLFDKNNGAVNNAETSSGDYSSGLSVSMPMGDLTIGLGYASTTGGTSVNETTQGVSVAYALPAATMKVGYESSDLSTDASTMAVSFSGSLDADTTWAIGYTDGEQGTASSTRTEAKISRSLGGGVSVYGEIQSLSGSTSGSGGTGAGTNMAVGTTVAF
jgi:hypothetical protein